MPYGLRTLVPDASSIEDALFLGALIPQRQVSRQDRPRRSSGSRIGAPHPVLRLGSDPNRPQPEPRS